MKSQLDRRVKFSFTIGEIFMFSLRQKLQSLKGWLNLHESVGFDSASRWEISEYALYKEGIRKI